MNASPRLILRVAIVGFALALAGCESTDSGAQSNSNNGNAPTTMPSRNNGGQNSNSQANTDNNSYIGNGAFGQSPP